MPIDIIRTETILALFGYADRGIDPYHFGWTLVVRSPDDLIVFSETFEIRCPLSSHYADTAVRWSCKIERTEEDEPHYLDGL